jgi:hypothetical protein
MEERRRMMALADLRRSPMMAHLLDALADGKDIGHYGRLTVAIVGSYFLDQDELVHILLQGRGLDEGEAQALVQQVAAHRYNPPSRAQIQEWQQYQDFPICPASNDPDACNVYHALRFPEAVYEDIEAYRTQQADAQQAEDVARGTA